MKCDLPEGELFFGPEDIVTDEVDDVKGEAERCVEDWGCERYLKYGLIDG